MTNSAQFVSKVTLEDVNFNAFRQSLESLVWAVGLNQDLLFYTQNNSHMHVMAPIGVLIFKRQSRSSSTKKGLVEGFL